MSDAPPPRTLAADFPLQPRFPLQQLLDAFAELARQDPTVHLLLSGRRSRASSINVVNYIEQHGLQQRIDYRPYYYHRDAPDLRAMPVVHIDRDIDPQRLTASTLQQLLAAGPTPAAARNLLFVTAFHPLKQEGNSTAMRVWLEHLRAAGYTTHLLYYVEDRPPAPPALRAASAAAFDHYYEVQADNPLTGINQSPLNIDVDDWCGPELLEAVSNICDRHQIHHCIVNYAFYSGVFLALPAYTRKILLTHDRFADRNRSMLAQGFKTPCWASLTSDGERTACLRADIVVALQQHEAGYFRQLTDAGTEVIDVPPLFPKRYQPAHSYDGGLAIGYFGSRNSVNEQNLVQFIDRWRANQPLLDNSRLLVAGGVSASLSDYIDEQQLQALPIERLGRFDRLGDFFARCDLVINPERGGSGIKIKTLETLAHGCALVSTAAGMVALPSDQPCHQAADIGALVDCVAQLAADPGRLPALAASSRQVYDRFHQRSQARLEQLLPTLGATLELSRHERVSVIIVIDQHSDGLQACLDSLLQQTHDQLDIILVEDQPDQRSQAVARDFISRCRHAQLLTDDRQQPPRCARERGLRQASGDYLLFLDANTTLPAHAIATLIAASTRHATRIVVAGDSLASSQQTPADFTTISGIDALWRSLGSGSEPLPGEASGTLIERRLLSISGLSLPQRQQQDLAMIPLLYLLAGKVAITTAPAAQPPPAATGNRDHDLVEHYQQLWQQLQHNIDQLGLQQLRAAICTRLLTRLLQQLNATPGSDASAPRLLDLLQRQQALLQQAAPALQQHYAEALRRFMAGITRQQALYASFALHAGGKLLIDHYQQQLQALSSDPGPDNNSRATP